MLFRSSQVKRYFLRQKIWTIADKFVIRDEHKSPIFYVKGKVFSLGDKLRFFDLDGKELLYIKQKLFSFRRLYRLFKGQRLYAKVWKKFTLFKNKFVIDIAVAKDYVVSGNFFNYRYDIFHAGRRVAVISKKWPAWTDHYKIEIVPGENDLLILASAIVIDMVSHRNEHHGHFGY